jgi:NAD(P)H-dependent FMN reductase
MIGSMAEARCRVLLISGSVRSASTNSATIRTVAALAPDGVEAIVYGGLLRLPHFNPDDDPDGGPVPAAVADFRAQLAATDALLFCTPENAGGMPGAFKNLLDWTVGGGETSGMPAGWINTSPRGAAGAHEGLRAVLGYTDADVVEAACLHAPMTSAAIGEDGLVTDPAVRMACAAALTALAEHVALTPPA